MLGFTAFHPTYMARVLGSRLGGGTKPNATISPSCWVSLRFTQPTWLGFWEVGWVEVRNPTPPSLHHVGFHCVSPNLHGCGFGK
ncbi:hypothetical protein [Limnospira platensis]|uniref:hypothetical protein n=2 Tax=Limnospira platensis TaxID=118562 RepID=UPI00139F294D